MLAKSTLRGNGMHPQQMLVTVSAEMHVTVFCSCASIVHRELSSTVWDEYWQNRRSQQPPASLEFWNSLQHPDVAVWPLALCKLAFFQMLTMSTLSAFSRSRMSTFCLLHVSHYISAPSPNNWILYEMYAGFVYAGQF